MSPSSWLKTLRRSGFWTELEVDKKCISLPFPFPYFLFPPSPLLLPFRAFVSLLYIRSPLISMSPGRAPSSLSGSVRRPANKKFLVHSEFKKIILAHLHALRSVLAMRHIAWCLSEKKLHCGSIISSRAKNCRGSGSRRYWDWQSGDDFLLANTIITPRNMS